MVILLSVIVFDVGVVLWIMMSARDESGDFCKVYQTPKTQVLVYIQEDDKERWIVHRCAYIEGDVIDAKLSFGKNARGASEYLKGFSRDKAGHFVEVLTNDG
jgi:hypothetical protein